MHTLTGPKTKTQASRRLVPIMADSKSVPDQIEILKAGTWPATSVKGPLTITTADLQEFKRNFDAGVGMPSGLKQLPIDFNHEEWDQAAGWITSLEVVGDSLMANVEWSSTGQAALEGGQYKCISPSFWPACCGEWYDPEDADVTARNVLTGAGLTNIPFFKGLTPIMASNTSEGGKNNNVIYINASEKEHSMTLDEIRVKDAASLTDEEKTFALEHKADLSADEQTRLGVAEAPKAEEPAADPEENKNKEGEPVADPELEAVQASLKSGESVVVKASVFNQLQSDVKAMKREKIEASVAEHLKRGAIKADQVKAWADQIEANPAAETLLAALPDNSKMAEELGSDQAVNAAAWDTVKERAEKVVADSQGKTDFNTAVKSVLAADKTLAEQVNAERN